MNQARPLMAIRLGIAIDSPQYGLQIAPRALGERKGAWLTTYTQIEGASSFYDGLANTDAMAAAGSEIAKWARGLDINGHTDWYIPSRDELELLYRHHKPTTETNYVYRAGDNPSSMPSGYPYTESSPAQTDLVQYREDGSEAFAPEWYWSSTQFSRDYAWYQGFNNGNQGYDGKSYEGRVRAVRRFLIE